MVYCGILWYIVVYCGILWYTVVYCGILWYTVVYCGILWSIILYYVVDIIIVDLLPYGRYQLRISALSPAGQGGPSDILIFMTDTGGIHV